MAANREPPEITALSSNLTSITDTVTVGDNLQWFANRLVEKTFVTRSVAQGILGLSGATPAYKAGQLTDSVFAVIRTSDRKKHWLDEFVSIFSTDRAYAELVEKLQRCVIETSPAPSVFPPRPTAALVPASPARDSEESPAPSSTATSSSSPLIQPDYPLNSHPPPIFWSLEKVKTTIKELQTTFGKLHAKTGIEMKKTEEQDKEFLEEFRSRLLLLPVRRATLHVKFFTANEKDIVEAESTKNILYILCRFVNYRNYEILYYVVINFCCDPLQQSMKDYCKSLEEFEASTTVEVYLSAIPDEVDEEIMNGFSKMVVKIDKPSAQCTLLEVRKLNKAIIEKSTLCSHSVYIGAVSRNCVVVRLRFPSSAVGWVLAAITPDFMTTHRITDVTLDGRQLYLTPDSTYTLVHYVCKFTLVCNSRCLCLSVWVTTKPSNYWYIQSLCLNRPLPMPGKEAGAPHVVLLVLDYFYHLLCMVYPSLVPRPSRAPARKEGLVFNVGFLGCAESACVRKFRNAT